MRGVLFHVLSFDGCGVMTDSSNSPSSGLIYGLEFQCRALSAVDGDGDKVKFLVGTQSLKMTNQVHLLEIVEDSGTLDKTIYQHPAGEVWDLVSSPTDSNMFISRHSSVDQSGNICRMEATLWRTLQDDLEAVSKLNISTEGDFPPPDINCALFAPGRGDRVMALAANQLVLLDFHQEEEKIVATGRLEGKGQTTLTTGTWNPHQNCQTFATVNEHNVRGWDTRNMKQTWHFENPCHQIVRSLDFNPNKQYHLATAGDDGCTLFWDIRATSQPLITRKDHSHWVWSVRFNQFHDQLVLTSSSDSHVVLASLASISSEPHGHLVDEEDGEEGNDNSELKPIMDDGVIKVFEDHEESVYAAAWSSADPWTFASLSYDGRLVINKVPRTVKFKILNLL